MANLSKSIKIEVIVELGVVVSIFDSFLSYGSSSEGSIDFETQGDQDFVGEETGYEFKFEPGYMAPERDTTRGYLEENWDKSTWAMANLGSSLAGGFATAILIFDRYDNISEPEDTVWEPFWEVGESFGEVLEPIIDPIIDCVLEVGADPAYSEEAARYSQEIIEGLM